jgi:hypothetical protein
MSAEPRDTGAATANFTPPAPIASGAGPFPGGGYALTFAGTSTGGTMQSIGPIATDPGGSFQVNGAAPQPCTITAPALPYIEHASVTPADGPVMTCQDTQPGRLVRSPGERGVEWGLARF